MQSSNWLNRLQRSRTPWLIGLWIALGLAGCNTFSSASSANSPSSAPRAAVPTKAPVVHEGVPKQFLGRQVIVTLASASKAQWDEMTAELAQTYRLAKIGAFPLSSIGVQCIVLQIPETQSMPDTIAKLQADPRVESIQTNQFFQSQTQPTNDPYAKFQYGVRAVGADLAHANSTGQGVKIAVIDTGVDVQHPDLQGRIVETENFVDGGLPGFAQDRHGTAVAGVIAARANNAIGIVGVAPDAEIIALKACWHRTPTSEQALCSSWTLARAIDVAIREGAQILNFSLAGPPDPLLKRLLTTAFTQGITVVAATLPAQREIGFPASLETVIAVLASGPGGNVSSPAQPMPHSLLAAPGMEIITTLPQQTYDFLSGSSLAAAHVSGIVALLLEHHPALSPAEIQTILQTTAHPVEPAAPLSSHPIGLVDACAALRRVLDRPVCPLS